MWGKEKEHQNALDRGKDADTILAASGRRCGLPPAPGTGLRTEVPSEGPPPKCLSLNRSSVTDSLCIYRQVIQVLCILIALSVKQIKEFLLHRFGVGIK